MPQLEHMEAIEKRLWGAADTLRANCMCYFLQLSNGEIAVCGASWGVNLR